MDIQNALKAQKEDSRLSSLKTGIHAAEDKRKIREDRERKLQILLQNALFLEEDEKRKKRWIDSIPLLDDEVLFRLIDATIRENLRYKQHKRNLVVELNSSVPEQRFQ